MQGPQATFSPPAPVRRRRSIAPWWVAVITLGTGAILAVVWFALGGLPFTNHAAYGRVPVPGAGALVLPAGDIRINFEEDGIVGENDSADMPADLLVMVSGAAGAVPVERISASLFSSSTNNTGHVPYGKIDSPSTGTYQVTTAASEQTSAVSPRVTFGEPPWNPFGPPIVGALLILAPFALLGLVLVLPLRRA